MTAPTVAVEWLLARAAVRKTGLLHVVSRRDSGALNPICGARTISSEKIETRHSLDDVALLCEGCGTIATSMGGTVLDGVALLLGLSSGAVSTVRLLEVGIDSIVSVVEPRKAGTDLTASVRNNGVMTPVLLRRTGRGLQLLDGGRRLDAARAAGHTTVPAVVRDIDEQHAVIAALSANLHRRDLDPISQARAYVDALMTLEVTKEALADGLGISRPQLSNTVRLLYLPDHLKEHVAAGRISAAHGRALLRLNGNPQAQDELADQILNDGMTTKDAEAAARRASLPASAPLVDVAALLAGLLDAQVKVTAGPTTARFTFAVPLEEMNRFLGRIGAPAVA